MGGNTIEILQYCSYICLIIAALLLITAVILFFKLKIRDVIYELSGKARTVSTDKMKSSYAVTGSLRQITGVMDDDESSETADIAGIRQQKKSKSADLKATKKVKQPAPSQTANSAETSVLPTSQSAQKKARASEPKGSKKVANQPAAQPTYASTEVINAAPVAASNAALPGFKITREVMVIHTDERIS